MCVRFSLWVLVSRKHAHDIVECLCTGRPIKAHHFLHLMLPSRNLPHGHIKKQLQSHYGFRTKHLYQEHLISLGSVFFEVRAAIPGEVDDNVISDNALSL